MRARHPGFVLVAGGHDHEPEFSALNNNNAAVVKGASNARVIWSIDLDFGADGLPVVKPTRITLDESVPVASDYLPLEKKWREKLLAVYPFLEAKLGEAAVPLDAREVSVRSVESNWGNFIVDQMRKAFGKPIADLAFINGGTLRIDDYIADDILFEDIGRTFGFSSYLRRIEMSGAEFRKILEAGYRGAGGTQGYFPQVSGFRVCVDYSRREGSRIVSLQLPAEDGWSEIDDEQQYSVVVPDFLYGGGDGYQIPKDRPVSRPASELIYLGPRRCPGRAGQWPESRCARRPGQSSLLQIAGEQTAVFRVTTVSVPKRCRLSALMVIILLSPSAYAESAHERARDLGIPFVGEPGPLNAITDVAGVEVGHIHVVRGGGGVGRWQRTRTHRCHCRPSARQIRDGRCIRRLVHA